MAKHLRRTGSSEARWRGIIRAQRRSGLSVEAFCRKNKLASSTFYFWRRKVAGGQAPSSSPRASRTGSASFVPVRVADEGSLNSPGRMEILLSGGHRVVVSPPVDGRALAEVVAVLSGKVVGGEDERC